MTDATEGFGLLESLKALAETLAEEIDGCEDQRTIAALARQYRETMVKVDELEGGLDDDDGIAAIIIRNRKPASD